MSSTPAHLGHTQVYSLPRLMARSRLCLGLPDFLEHHLRHVQLVPVAAPRGSQSP